VKPQDGEAVTVSSLLLTNGFCVLAINFKSFTC